LRGVLRLSRPAGWVLAGFILVNSAGELLWPGFAADHLWIRSARLLGPLWRVFALALALALLAPERVLARRPRLRRAGAWLCAGFAVSALADAASFWWLLAAGRIRSPAVVPFSLLVAALLGASALRMARARIEALPRTSWRAVLFDAAAAGATAFAALLAFIFTYGPTDYTRPADCAVVLGARAYADGRPSLALYDRTMTGVELYRRGLVGKLVVSGAVGPSGVSEPRVMRRLAVAKGVRPQDVILDELGVNSWATVLGARRLAARRGWRRVLLVSHYYHLPRLRLAADRAGLVARTVPCRQTRRLRKEPYGVLRECAGLVYYYLFHPPAE